MSSKKTSKPTQKKTTETPAPPSTTNENVLEMTHTVPATTPAEPVLVPVEEPLYPCDKCGTLRTKSQGGTVFTVCDTCWEECWEDKKRTKQASVPKIAPQDYSSIIPTIGRILHFMQSATAVPQAAILTAVHEDGELTCCVFDPVRGAVMRKRPLEQPDAPNGYFIWPPRL
jgi:hypothetical protein